MWILNNNRLINLSYARCVEPRGLLELEVSFIDDSCNRLSYETEKLRDEAYIKIVESLGSLIDGINLKIIFEKKYSIK